MSRPVTAQVQLKVSWWFKLWLEGLILVAQLSGRVPDPEKVEAMAKRGIKVKAKLIERGEVSDPQVQAWIISTKKTRSDCECEFF